VFSKDRALQLQALLVSYRAQVSDPQPLTVLFAASSPEHRDAYEEVREELSSNSVVFVEQESADSFRKQLMTIIQEVSFERIFFLVDDIVFIEPVNLSHLCSWATSSSVPSMRLGRNIEWAYTSSQPERSPSFRRLPDQLLAWRWGRGELDWAYPLSLDGNIFMTEEIKRITSNLAFSSPNTLEDAMQRFKRQFSNRWGICYAKSRIVNLPLNRVQNDIANLHGNLHQDDLLKAWNRGLRLDVSALTGLVNSSVHEDLHPPLRAGSVRDGD
jgi:hypothetical protein